MHEALVWSSICAWRVKEPVLQAESNASCPHYEPTYYLLLTQNYPQLTNIVASVFFSLPGDPSKWQFPKTGETQNMDPTTLNPEP